MCLPHPFDEAAPPVNAVGFAKLTGIPKATVMHRYHRHRAGQREVRPPNREEVLDALLARRDRQIMISFVLPDGRTLSGGVRELIRQVLGDPRLRWARAEPWLGTSAIRARLRRVPGWPKNPEPSGVLWAFGFAPCFPGDIERPGPGSD